MRWKKLGLKQDEDIFVLGNIPDYMISDLYSAADVFMFPSIKEGWGLVVLEAMASGLPVIASKIEPLTEFLEDGVNSLLVSPTDYKTFSDCVIKIIEDQELETRLKNNGKTTAGKYSWESTAEGHMEIYNGILNNSNTLNNAEGKVCS